MRIPGFTAERAISERKAVWKGTTTIAAHGAESRIVPQFCFTHPGGYYTTCCYCWSEFGGGCYCHTLPRYVLQ